MMLFNLLRYSVFFLILIIFSPLIFFIRFIIKKIKGRDILDKYLEIIFNVKTKIILVLINYIGVKSSGFLIEHNLATYYFKGVKFNINHHFVFTRKTFSLENTFRDYDSRFNIMTLTTFFWILVGASILVLMIIRFGIKKELLTPVFWLLIGISFMVLMGVLWNVIKGS